MRASGTSKRSICGLMTLGGAFVFISSIGVIMEINGQFLLSPNLRTREARTLQRLLKELVELELPIGSSATNDVLRVAGAKHKSRSSPVGSQRKPTRAIQEGAQKWGDGPDDELADQQMASPLTVAGSHHTAPDVQVPTAAARTKPQLGAQDFELRCNPLELLDDAGLCCGQLISINGPASRVCANLIMRNKSQIVSQLQQQQQQLSPADASEQTRTQGQASSQVFSSMMLDFERLIDGLIQRGVPKAESNPSAAIPASRPGDK